MPNPYVEREPRCTQEQYDTLCETYRRRNIVSPPISGRRMPLFNQPGYLFLILISARGGYEPLEVHGNPSRLRA